METPNTESKGSLPEQHILQQVDEVAGPIRERRDIVPLAQDGLTCGRERVLPPAPRSAWEQ
jgi:hypothetical protein